MNIKSVTNNVNLQGNPENVVVKKSAPEEKKDQLKISEKALELNKNAALNPKLEEIKEKIRTKFYDSDEVINNISREILKEIKQEK